MPQWCVNRMFEMITKGELEAAVIAGGEALARPKKEHNAQVSNWIGVRIPEGVLIFGA